MHELSNLSLWHSTMSAEEWGPGRTALGGDLTVDVAIVGAGYTGLWTAYYLLQRDPSLRIALLEAQVVGFGASGRNGGWCSALLPMGMDAIAAASSREGAIRLQTAMHETVAEVGRVVAAEAARLWQGAAVPPLLSSFRPEALKGAREGAADLPRAQLLDTLWPGWFEVTQANTCTAVVTHHALMDAALIANLRGTGLRALVYTVNEWVDARRLLALGIDGLITDAVDRFAPGLAALP